MKQEGILIIYSSPNGRDAWAPVLPKDVPEWVKEPDVLGKLVAGETACKADENPAFWYRAEQVKTPAAQTEIGAVY